MKRWKSNFLKNINQQNGNFNCRQCVILIDVIHFGDSESLGAGVYELRIHYGPGYRLYYMNSNAREAKVIILLCGGDKSTQKKDIQTAKKYAVLIKESDHA